MEVRILGSSVDAPRERQYASSYLINGVVSIDAGTLGFHGTPQNQARVRHIFLTHSHMDHIASLPVFLENAYDPEQPEVTIHALPQTLDALRRFVFNDVIWPDFVQMRMPGRPFLQLRELRPEQAQEVEGLRVLPVPVNHIVPTVGYIVSDGKSTVVFSGDTAATQRIWELSGEFPAPRSVFLECTFPDEMEQLALISAHLTPSQFGLERAKMPSIERLFAIHLKDRYRQVMEQQLAALRLPELVIAEGDACYSL
jgi:ribonuclease BN (tRNA processing enzyme)